MKVSVEADKPDEEDLDLASRCVDLLEKSDPKKHFEMLSLFRDEFNKAGLEQKSKLLPSIFSQVCEIGIKMNENGDKELCEKSFEMAHETVKLLANDDLAMIPIRLYLQGVSYLQNCNYDGAVDLCYEFFTQAFVLYEEEISDSKEQVWALQLLSGTLLEMECFKEEEHGSLRSQLALASARLLRKADQTRAILSVCHVMWSSKVKQNDGSIKLLKDDKKVVNFIGKAIKTTDKCLESELKVQLYVEILEKIYNFKCDGFSLELLQSHQETVTKKIEAEKINNPSIEQHWKKIKILLSGEKVPEEISEPEIKEQEEKQPEVEPVAPMAEPEVESETADDSKPEAQPEKESDAQPEKEPDVQPEIEPEATDTPSSSNEQSAENALPANTADQPAEQSDAAASGDVTEN